MLNVYFTCTYLKLEALNTYLFFFSKKTINTYLKLEIRVECREFLAFKYVVFFGTQYSFVFVLAGRGY